MTAQDTRRDEAITAALPMLATSAPYWTLTAPDYRLPLWRFGARLFDGRIAVALLRPEEGGPRLEAWEFSAEELEAKRDMRQYHQLTTLDTVFRLQGVQMGAEDYLAGEPRPPREEDDEA